MMLKFMRMTMVVSLLLGSAAGFAAEPAPVPAQPVPNATMPAANPASSQRPAATDQQPANTQKSASGQQPSPRRGASDRLDLDTTVVTGNRELPKVLYIVPWKKADIGNLPAQPFNTLLDEVLAPVDRDVFRREVTYYGAVSSSGDASAEAPLEPAGRNEK